MVLSATIEATLDPGELQEWLAVVLTLDAMKGAYCMTTVDEARAVFWDLNALQRRFEEKYGLDDMRDWALSRTTGKIWYSD